MTEKREPTDHELLTAILKETKGAHACLHKLVRCLALFGIALFSIISLRECSTLLGLG